MMPRVLTTLFCFLTAATALAQDAPETLLLQDPTVSARHVAFVYAGDLWLAERAGGVAQRLTSHVGREFAPRFSPDGQMLAFSGEYDGNTDVYIMPVTGGAPRRLTWHPEADLVQGWHPDGKRVLFTSPMAGGAPVARLFLVTLDGGMPEALEIPKAARAAFSPDARRVAYTPVPDAFRTWKRYRGGRIPPIWIYDLASREIEEIPHVVASDTFPCWLEGVVYFASDRDGHMNLYRFTPGAKSVEQLTRFTDFDIRSMSAGAGVIAFEQAGAIHLYDPAAGTDVRLKITVVSDGLTALPRWQEVKGFVRSAAPAPNGKRAVFEARGEIITAPREFGDTRNLTDSPGAHDRDPAWSPDGKRICWFTDAGGEYRLAVRDALGHEPIKDYDLGPGGFFYRPQWSGDGKHILFFDKTGRLAFLTLEGGKVTEVARNTGTLGVFYPSSCWSPDSQWIAFTRRNPDTAYDRVCLYEVATGTSLTLTDAFGSADSPAFSRDGKVLFFTASVDSGPQKFGLDMSASAARASKSNLYLAVLKKTEKNPLAPKSDEGVDDDKDKKKSAKKSGEEKKEPDPPGDEKKDDPGDGDKKGDEPEPDKDGKNGADAGEKGKTDDDEDEDKDAVKGPLVDPEGLDQRILALPIGAGYYDQLSGIKGKLLFLESAEGGESELKSFDLDTRKVESVAKDVSGYEVSHKGKTVLAHIKDGWVFMSTEGKDRKEVQIAGAKVRVDPAVEWPQILREVWRIQRDFFYDRNMHGVDWPAMWTRWSAFLPHVRHRADLNLVIGEMMGELCCGHEYVDGGETPRAPGGPAVGLLGCDVEIAEGRYRITRIYRGQNWSPGMRAPLTEPGVDARVGDFIVSVDAVPLLATANFFAAFADTADRQVQLVLSAKADGADPRTMTIVPVGDDAGLRRQAWIEGNRRRVETLSGGRLAYVYMPDTGGAGLAAFHRDYFSQVDKEGVILDERYNRGGKVADYVIQILSRQVLCYWMNREEWLGRTPFGTVTGPKVMIVNERAGSGGDAMPWMFQQMKLGPVVGTRTWGGLVGISGYPSLMDGGSVTAASFGIMDPQGRWVVENVGVTPDVEVVEIPKEIIAGRDPQLEKAVALAMQQLQERAAVKKPTYTPPDRR